MPRRNIALTILSDNLTFLHRNTDKFCLRVELDPAGGGAGTVGFKTFELSDELHAALAQVKETESQRLS